MHLVRINLVSDFSPRRLINIVLPLKALFKIHRRQMAVNPPPPEPFTQRGNHLAKSPRFPGNVPGKIPHGLRQSPGFRRDQQHRRLFRLFQDFKCFHIFQPFRRIERVTSQIPIPDGNPGQLMNFIIDAQIHRWFVQSFFHRHSFSHVSFVRKHGSYPSLIWISRIISCFVRRTPASTPHVFAI